MKVQKLHKSFTTMLSNTITTKQYTKYHKMDYCNNQTKYHCNEFLQGFDTYLYCPVSYEEWHKSNEPGNAVHEPTTLMPSPSHAVRLTPQQIQYESELDTVVI